MHAPSMLIHAHPCEGGTVPFYHTDVSVQSPIATHHNTPHNLPTCQLHALHDVVELTSNCRLVVGWFNVFVLCAVCGVA